MKELLILITIIISAQCIAQNGTGEKRKEWLGVLTLTEKYTVEANWTPADQAVVGEHYKRLVQMKDSGTVILAGKMELQLNDPEMKGLVIFYAKDEKDALQFMLEDPAVKSKIMLAKVYPYGVAVKKCD